MIAICAIICGANDWEAVDEYGRDNQAWFKTFLALPNGIASHAKSWRVFSALDPEQFQSCFVSWIQAVSQVTAGEVIAIDGKFVRGSLDKNNGAHNFAILRHIALNALKQETSVKLGLYNKRLEAAWNHNYLLKVLATLFN